MTARRKPPSKREQRALRREARRDRLAVRCGGCGAINPPERDVRIELAPGDFSRVVGACAVCGSETATYAGPL